MIHQTQYQWLDKMAGPKVMIEAIKLYGTKEIVGSQHSKEILSWAKELGLEKTYNADEIAWCGLFAAIVVKRAGFIPVEKPLWARNWNNFGTKQNVAMFGDILVFTRPDGGGHVGFYVGEDDTCYHVLGGNQSDSVSITRILKSRCVAIRRCPWKISQPKEVQKFIVKPSGEISTNER